MSTYTCGRCLYADEAGSSDVVWCWVREEHRKVNDYPCARWTEAPRSPKRRSDESKNSA